MKLIVESLIDGRHYGYYCGYNKYGEYHKWAEDKKDAKIYTKEKDLHNDLALLSKDYTALKFKILK